MKFRIKKQVYLVALAGFLFVACGIRKKPLTFVLLSKNINNVPGFQTKLNISSLSYIIYNYNNSEYCEKQIDSFANKLGNENKDKYYSFIIDFYKASDETNIENLSKNPRQLDRYSNQHDYIRNYSWNYKGFLGKFKYKNGKSMDADRIRVIDAPPLKN